MLRSWDQQVFVTDWRNFLRWERCDGLVLIERGLRLQGREETSLKVPEWESGRVEPGHEVEGLAL